MHTTRAALASTFLAATLALGTATAQQTKAPQTKRWGDLNITLEGCFRASSGTDSGCNLVLTNTGTAPLRVPLEADSETVTLPDGSVARPRELIFGGQSGQYRTVQLLPTGISVRAQLNYNLAKGVTTLKALRVGDAEFLNVALAQDLPDEPAVNPAGVPVTTAQGEQVKLGLLDCLRVKTSVTCSFAVTSTVDENLRVSSSSSDGTWLVTRRGLVRSADSVSLGGDDERYTAQSLMPARRSLLSQVTFTLPETDTSVPYLQLNGYSFRNLPVTAQAGPRLLNPAGAVVDAYRVRDYAGKLDTCTYVQDGLKCDFTLTNRTDTGYRLEVTSTDNMFLGLAGVWYGARTLTAAGTSSPYRVNVPLSSGGSGTVSVLYAAPAGLKSVPYLRFAGLEFENVPVR
ncbi:hypothetical protein [Deinococcus marmoris]|uniref:hypothetical protein n=1 Tax=Deinococcus marmoris TaxID=249408 RepID=UPI000496B577|nr:hypothetical protein [Deinococcus marmoris]